ncbi:MAG TPA: hypothetical protein VM470_02090 [Acidimicrobiia bacterium]|nr:hypothetical protein [Acidimicrobiia bacterium]
MNEVTAILNQRASANYSLLNRGAVIAARGSLILRHLRRAGIEEPERQSIVTLPDGSVAIIDLAWPRYFKGVEIDGLDRHGSARALEHDLKR